jgi:hypothetical protein
MSEARASAFEKCKTARAAALQRKREAKEAAKNAPPPEPEPVAPEPETVAPEPAAPEPAAPEPVVEEPAPTPAPTPHPSVVLEEEDDDFEVLDPTELLQLLHKQQELISALHEDVRDIKTHQADLSSSFVQHGVKQAYSLNFV